MRTDFGGGKSCFILRRVGVSAPDGFFERFLIEDSRF
jgi:hypothetical protein